MFSVDSITVSPDLGIRNSTRLPTKRLKMTNDTTLLTGETQVTAENRYRRLIPYMTYYVPSNDYNVPVNYVPMMVNYFCWFNKLFIDNSKFQKNIQFKLKCKKSLINYANNLCKNHKNA